MRYSTTSTFGLLLLAACSSSREYTLPVTKPAAQPAVRVVDGTKSAVWRRTVTAFGKSRFEIIGLDEGAGLLFVTTGGDPEQFLDCGHISSTVTDLQGTRSYSFPAARAMQRYELGNRLHIPQDITRSMTFGASITLVFESLGPHSTGITANVKYVLTRTRIVDGDKRATPTDTASFTSGETGSFPDLDGRAITCVSNGLLEGEVLSLVHKQG